MVAIELVEVRGARKFRRDILAERRTLGLKERGRQNEQLPTVTLLRPGRGRAGQSRFDSLAAKGRHNRAPDANLSAADHVDGLQVSREAVEKHADALDGAQAAPARLASVERSRREHAAVSRAPRRPEVDRVDSRGPPASTRDVERRRGDDA